MRAYCLSKSMIGKLAAFWDGNGERNAKFLEPAAQSSEEACFSDGSTLESAIAECEQNSDCFGGHVCIGLVVTVGDRGEGDVKILKRLDFETETETD